ncbi:hypothetical protein OAT19_02765, partial [Gammaproteobacteria bacterium]|nr:hypothetical protein [Gammaproteobacteria bacterium]
MRNRKFVSRTIHLYSNWEESMNRLIKYCLAAIVALGFQVPAFAQASLEEVIVTAQRTEQSLQDVPIAVTALSGDDLVEKQVVTF